MEKQQSCFRNPQGGFDNQKVESLNKIKTKHLTKNNEKQEPIIEKKKIGRPKLFKDDIKLKVEKKKILINFD
jgi:hypothetical protein